MAYIVNTPLVIAKTPGGDRYVYQGGSLPDDTDPDQVKQLVDEKQVSEGEATSDGTAEGAFDVDRPGGNASLEEWQGYALAHGMTEDEIEGVSRNDLRDRFA